jgi:hypothetical protein
MVRRGSTVRVRQRAWLKRLQISTLLLSASRTRGHIPDTSAVREAHRVAWRRLAARSCRKRSRAHEQKLLLRGTCCCLSERDPDPLPGGRGSGSRTCSRPDSALSGEASENGGPVRAGRDPPWADDLRVEHDVPGPLERFTLVSAVVGVVRPPPLTRPRRRPAGTNATSGTAVRTKWPVLRARAGAGYASAPQLEVYRSSLLPAEPEIVAPATFAATDALKERP